VSTLSLNCVYSQSQLCLLSVSTVSTLSLNCVYSQSQLCLLSVSTVQPVTEAHKQTAVNQC